MTSRTEGDPTAEVARVVCGDSGDIMAVMLTDPYGIAPDETDWYGQHYDRGSRSDMPAGDLRWIDRGFVTAISTSEEKYGDHRDGCPLGEWRSSGRPSTRYYVGNVTW